MSRVVEHILQIGSSGTSDAVIRWSEDGSTPPEIGLRTRQHSWTGVSQNVPITMSLAEACQLVELLHEAISTVTAWAAEKGKK